MSCCMLNNKPVSLCKGQNQGESSPYSNVLKNIMSPRCVQNGVSPDYVSMSCADNSMDLILNKNNSTASSTFSVEEAVCFLMLMIKIKLTRLISSKSLMISLQLISRREYWK